MFTDDQMRVYDELRNGGFASGGNIPLDADWQPPRVAFADDFPLLADVSEFSGTALLLVGFQSEDLRDCECEDSHITYAAIREDGKLSPVVTSNTGGELELIYGIDPMMVMLGLIDPGDPGEPVVPSWDAAREVTPDEWPAETISRESGTQTDMTDFEF